MKAIWTIARVMVDIVLIVLALGALLLCVMVLGQSIFTTTGAILPVAIGLTLISVLVLVVCINDLRKIVRPTVTNHSPPTQVPNYANCAELPAKFHRPPEEGLSDEREASPIWSNRPVDIESATRLRQASAQWPEIYRTLNPEKDPVISSLIDDIRGMTLGEPGAALSAIENASFELGIQFTIYRALSRAIEARLPQ